MQGDFDYLINNLEHYLQPNEWVLYNDLLKSKDNLMNINFNNFKYINDHSKYNDIKLLLIDFNNNFNQIVSLVKEILIDKLKDDVRFEYIDDNNIKVKLWHLEGLTYCDNCGIIWDGYAQCVCLYDY